MHLLRHETKAPYATAPDFRGRLVDLSDPAFPSPWLFVRRLHLVYRCTATPTKEFYGQSFIEWHLKEQFFQQATNLPYRTDLRLMFRTRRRSGILFLAQNQQKSDHLVLEVGRQHLLSNSI